uniref:Uncharacterized protein n=1 Tax=Oryza barthii TaxID=65489 RepID=A0A0D3GFW5_9ORYZ
MALKNLLLLVFLTALLFFFLDGRQGSRIRSGEVDIITVEDTDTVVGMVEDMDVLDMVVVTVVAVAMVVVEATEEDKVVVGLDK